MARHPLHPDPSNRGPVFRRYRNRRYYSVDAAGYVSSDELLRHRKLVVVDASTGRDITRWAVSAAKLERERRRVEAEGRRLGIVSYDEKERP